jgi:hypothetical protein
MVRRLFQTDPRGEGNERPGNQHHLWDHHEIRSRTGKPGGRVGRELKRGERKAAKGKK